MKKYFSLFLYVSIIFLVISLIKGDFLHIPVIYSGWKIILSLLLLFLGFLFDALAWQKIVNSNENNRIKLNDAISSMGLSIFGKYIPGKFWIILGRAGYLAKKYELNEKDTAILSLNAQFLSLWVGLLLGGFGLLLIGNATFYGMLGLALWLILTFILFTRVPHKLSEVLFNRLFNKQISIPSLNFRNISNIAPWYFINWLLWIASFYFLVDALTINSVSPMVGFIFAIGGTIGLAVLFAPGGIGVREGILFVFLILCGLEAPVATSISISSRLWFLCGEFFIFLLGCIFKQETNRI